MVVEYPLLILGGPLPITRSLVEPGQIAHGDEITFVGLQALQRRSLGMSGMAASEAQRAQVGPGR